MYIWTVYMLKHYLGCNVWLLFIPYVGAIIVPKTSFKIKKIKMAFIGQ